MSAEANTRICLRTPWEYSIKNDSAMRSQASATKGYQAIAGGYQGLHKGDLSMAQSRLQDYQAWHYQADDPFFVGHPGPYLLPQLVMLVLSAVFCIGTMTTYKNGTWRQPFDLLGCCKQMHPAYTSMSTFLTASMIRRLVRGESRPIIFVRAVILICIVVGLPVIGKYTIVFAPFTAQFYIRTSTLTSHVSANIRMDPAAIYVFDPWSLLAQFSGHDELHQNGVTSMTWTENLYNISVSVSIPEMDGVYIRAGDLTANALLNYLDHLQPTLLVPGAPLIGVLSWTRRDLITDSHWGISIPRITLFTSDVVSLYPDPRLSNNSLSPNVATVTFFQANEGFPTRIMRDTVDETPLSGVSTFGGFWTFLNGAFVLIFGANGGARCRHSVLFTSFSGAHWFNVGIKIFRPSTLKEVLPAPRQQASSLASARADDQLQTGTDRRRKLRPGGSFRPGGLFRRFLVCCK
ncbi:hypothetical protein C8R43DRAFT_946083 [Mycena crocata]|nr:hypothetical protein C8R43DRAFT_946083 [Mycena crocata]